MRHSRSFYAFLVAITLGLALAVPAANAAPGGPPPKGYAPGQVLVKLSPGTSSQAFARRSRASCGALGDCAAGVSPDLSLRDRRWHLAACQSRCLGWPARGYLCRAELRRRRSLRCASGHPGWWAAAPGICCTVGAAEDSSSRGTYCDAWRWCDGRHSRHWCGSDTSSAGGAACGRLRLCRSGRRSKRGWGIRPGSRLWARHACRRAGRARRPQAKIMPLRTLKPDGTGDIWTQITAIGYAMEHGADVINLSYSFEQQSKVFDDIIAEVTCNAPADFDCRAKTRPGAVVVAAAGNSGASIREYPAANHASGLLAVAASTEADALADFSTYGSWVQVAAPGDRLLSSIPGSNYATWSGTSMAAPIVAGVAALTRAANPGLGPTEAVTRIATTAARIKADVRRRVDAAEAVGWAAPKCVGKNAIARCLKTAAVSA